MFILLFLNYVLLFNIMVDIIRKHAFKNFVVTFYIYTKSRKHIL